MLHTAVGLRDSLVYRGERELGALEEVPDSGGSDGEPPDPWDMLPEPDEPATSDEIAHPGAYRGRRRASAGRRTRLAAVAAVVAVVGVVLIGSSLAVRSITAPVAAPVVPPSETPSLSPSPSPLPPPPIDEPSPVAGLGPAPEPSPPPTLAPPPEPSAPASEEPPDPSPDDPSPSPTEAVSLALEAESAELGGGAEVVFEQKASGGEAVDLRGDWPGHNVRFAGVTVDRAGGYELTIHYFSRCCDTTVWVWVNGDFRLAVGLPEPSGNSVGTRTVGVDLDAGGDTIVISAANDEPAPKLDLITVTD
jgi:hypothetical protein